VFLEPAVRGSGLSYPAFKAKVEAGNAFTREATSFMNTVSIRIFHRMYFFYHNVVKRSRREALFYLKFVVGEGKQANFSSS
jgi:hypothetical protein